MDAITALAAAQEYANKKALSKIVWQHPRGEAEFVGDTSSAYPVAGMYEQATENITVNKVNMPVYCSDAAGYFDFRVFIINYEQHIYPENTPVRTGTLSVAATNHVSGGLQTIKFDDLDVKTGQYIYVVLMASVGNVVVPRWTTAAPSDPARHSFMFATERSFAGTIYRSSPLPTYGAATFTMYRVPPIPDGSISETELSSTVQTKLNPSPTRVILPDEITAVVGDKLQVYTRGIVEAPNPYYDEVEYTCDVGKGFPRYFEHTPVADDVGTKPLTVTVRDRRGVAMATGVCNLVIKAPVAQPAAVKNVLCVGDSLTSGLQWPQEMYRRLTQAGGSPAGLGYGNISFIGTHPFPDFPTQKAIGYGGWTWDTYMGVTGNNAAWVNNNPDAKDASDLKSIYLDTNGKQWVLETIQADRIKVIPYGGATQVLPASGTLTWQSGGTHQATITYTTATPEASTPFWDSAQSKFSFSAFCTANGYPGIDVMYVLLGWNGLLKPNKALASDHALNIVKAKAFIDQLHMDYPDALVRLLGLQIPSPNGGLGTNYGAKPSYSYYGLLRSVNGWNMALQSLAKEAGYSTFCRYISVAAQLDSEYNMPSELVAVNSRNSTTEKRGTNGIHPATEGYLQIADVAYRDFVRTYCAG